MEDYTTLVKDQEKKILPQMVYGNRNINPEGFAQDLDESTVFIRIHDSICLPCSSFVFDKIIANYSNSSKFKLQVLGSYHQNYNFIGDVKKLGLEKIGYTNSANEMGFIGADSLNVPYLFTIKNKKLSSILILLATSDNELQTYFQFIDRILP